MLKKILVLPILAAAFLLMSFEYSSSPAKGENEYIGAKKCGMCHKKDKTGNQLAIWEKSAHAKTFEQLTSDAGKAIAKENGIDDPQKAETCLKCHATGQHEGAKLGKKFDVTAGVQCEACHGAGSNYKAMKVMKDHAKSVAGGMTDFTVEGSAKAVCATCHENAEIHPTNKDFDYEANWAKITHMIPKG